MRVFAVTSFVLLAQPSHAVTHALPRAGTLSRVVTLLSANSDTTLVVSDLSCLDEAELEKVNLHPVPLASPSSFDLLLDDDISRLEVAVLRWTYPEDRLEGEGEEESVYDDTLGMDVERQAEQHDGGSSLTGGEGEAELLGGGAEDHTYVNLQPQQQQQQQQPQQGQPQLGLGQPQVMAGSVFLAEDLTEKEKMFLEEDEDAG